MKSNTAANIIFKNKKLDFSPSKGKECVETLNV